MNSGRLDGVRKKHRNQALSGAACSALGGGWGSVPLLTELGTEEGRGRGERGDGRSDYGTGSAGRRPLTALRLPLTAWRSTPVVPLDSGPRFHREWNRAWPDCGNLGPA